MRFTVNPVGRFGAEVHGIDLRKIEEAEAHRLRALVAEFQILIFREQALSPAAQLRLTRCFGDPEPGIARRPQSHQVPGYSNLLYLSNAPESPTSDYGSAWHSDGLAYARVPHGVTILHCITCPLGIGDTLFANQYEAYEAMPDPMKRDLDNLYWYLPKIAYSEVPSGKALIHPIIRTHEKTGRHFFFCSPSARRIRGMTQSSSAQVLQLVHEQQTRHEFVYRHSWKTLDVVVWENCALLHNRADIVDFKTQGLRVMHRSATSGGFEAIECKPE